MGIDIILSDFVQSLSVRVSIITLLILINLVLSVWESIKLRNFDPKKLPGFITDWVLCVIALSVVELIVVMMYESELILNVFIGLRELIVFAILMNYIKKMIESFKVIGWTVNTDKLEAFVEDTEDITYDKVKENISYGNVKGVIKGTEVEEEFDYSKVHEEPVYDILDNTEKLIDNE